MNFELEPDATDAEVREMTGAPDFVIAFLAEVQERSEHPLAAVGAPPVSNDAVRRLMESAADVSHLLAGLEAVLALPARWDAFGDGHDAQSECAAELREAIARALPPGCQADVARDRQLEEQG